MVGLETKGKTEMSHQVGGVEKATQYLEDGGLEKTIDYASDAVMNGHASVLIDSELTLALCILADEAIKLRMRGRLAAEYK